MHYFRHLSQSREKMSLTTVKKIIIGLIFSLSISNLANADPINTTQDAAHSSLAKPEIPLIKPQEAATSSDTEKKAPPVARTLVDPKIDIEDLRLVIQPMTKEDLTIEADAWFRTLRTKVAQISNAELAVRRKNRELAAIKSTNTAPIDSEKSIPNSEDKAEVAKNDAKIKLVDQSTKLSIERSEIIDHLKVILNQIDLLGGDTKAMRAYADAVSTTKIEVSDYASTLARLKSWGIAEDGGISWIKKIALFMSYLVASFFVAKLIKAAIYRSLSMSSATSNLLRNFIVDWSGKAILFFGFLAGLSALEIDLSPLFAAIGAAGLVVGLALQGTLSNLASGLLIMANKPFDINDDVEVGGDIKGQVRSVSIFSTLILTPENTLKIVPNNTIWGGVIVNHSTGKVTPAHKST
jgi:small conductance mechanosensitive channel